MPCFSPLIQRFSFTAFSSLLIAQSFRGNITPRYPQSFTRYRCVRFRQIYNCIAAPSPAAAHRFEDIRIAPDEIPLLVWSQLHDTASIIRIAKGREDFPGHAKIGMIDVR